MPRLAIGIEYAGTAFCGWQSQVHACSVQEAVQEAVAVVADEPVSIVAAGRTDAGVHSLGQVGHFDTKAQRDERAWLLGINSNLPPDISIAWVKPVTDGFHARYSAIERTYHYLIFCRRVRAPLFHSRAWWLREALDVGAMQDAAGVLLGEHDFSAFRAAQCQAKSPRRELRALSLRRVGAFIVIECRANAFLHHMVRNIVGSLVKIGRGEADAEWLRHVLASRDRRAGGVTAEAGGLYLTRVSYPAEHGIPDPAAVIPDDL
ncbi:MAG: tRNA pseudouridine(38-40) synthase TruA [Gammaproteobacteria bacterium]|nr:tRNA pseudouridine(38-40) synthase TruA [Gammaproteobacteria bacterium]